jgi:bifunctional oligoribonuclease and PAP phosphatase NrnA
MKDLASALMSARSVILSTHAGPDGDGLGSLVAVGRALEAQGARVLRVISDPLPSRYRFLDPEAQIRTVKELTEAEQGHGWDLVLILDTHQWEMLGSAKDWLKERELPTFFLDHHPQSCEGRKEVFGDCDATATGELVYRLLRYYLGWSITQEVAEALYVAISFDTNSFKYIRSNPAALSIAADLVTRGVDTNWIYRNLFASNSQAKARLLGWVLSSAAFECEGRLAYVLVPHQVVKELCLERDEMRDCITHLLEIKGVEVAVTVKEMSPGEVQISLRSKGTWPINGVARQLGGGGHPLAAGCDFNGSMAAAWEALRTPLFQLCHSGNGGQGATCGR